MRKKMWKRQTKSTMPHFKWSDGLKDRNNSESLSPTNTTITISISIAI